MNKLRVLAVAAALAVSTAAIAAVSIDADGNGFVGKGDVQIAFTWNNAQLQSNVRKVSFSYDLTDTYVAVCTFTTGEGTKGERTHNVPHTTSQGVASELSYDVRQRNQFTGFLLKGWAGAPVVTGAKPVLGAACPGNEGHDGIWTNVILENSTGGLFVTFEGNKRPLQ